MPNSVSLRGVGGWLALYILTLAIFSPLFLLGSTAQAFREIETINPQIAQAFPGYQAYKSASWVAAFFFSGVVIWAGYCLWKHHIPSSVRNAILAMWLVTPAMLAIDYFLTSMTFGAAITSADYWRELVIALPRWLIYAGVWTAYLKMSKRVENTYFNLAAAASTSDDPRKIEPDHPWYEKEND